MINKDGQIEVPVGCSFNDGKTSYCAFIPRICRFCCFYDSLYDNVCMILACQDDERSDGEGVHFIKQGGEK